MTTHLIQAPDSAQSHRSSFGRGVDERSIRSASCGVTVTVAFSWLCVGLAVGCAAPIKGLLFGPDPPLNFITDSLDIMAGAMIPSMMLVLGSVLHKGPGSGKVPFKVILGVLGMRQIVIPFLGKTLSEPPTPTPIANFHPYS